MPGSGQWQGVLPMTANAADHPTNTVRVVAGRGVWRAVIDECVVCGRCHHHSADDPTLAEGELSHRVRHCPTVVVGLGEPPHRVRHCPGNVRDPGGYYLQLGDASGAPGEWLRQHRDGDNGGESA